MARGISASALLLLLLPALAAGQSLALEAAAVDGLYRLRLPAALGDSWSEVNVARLAVRSAGTQRSLTHAATVRSTDLELRLGATGCSLVLAELGPAASRGRADSWQRATYASKIVACPSTGDATRDQAARRNAGPVLMAKVGSPVEIRPLFNPATLTAGSDLALRIYTEGEPLAGTEITATAAGGSGARAESDRVGIATVTLPVAGLWTLRFVHLGATAELTFEVLD